MTTIKTIKQKFWNLPKLGQTDVAEGFMAEFDVTRGTLTNKIVGRSVFTLGEWEYFEARVLEVEQFYKEQIAS